MRVVFLDSETVHWGDIDFSPLKRLLVAATAIDLIDSTLLEGALWDAV